MKALRAVAAMLLLCGSEVAAQQPSLVERVGSAVILRYSGGTVAFSGGLAHTVNRQSSLNLEWYVVNDSSLGVVLDGAVGAAAYFAERGGFRYYFDARVLALDSISAFEVRVLTFNVWKEFRETLSFTQLEDMRPGQRKNFAGLTYGYYGESGVRDHTTSIAYVARVLHRDGRTTEIGTEPVLRIARRIQASVSEQDLTPKPEPIRP